MSNYRNHVEMVAKDIFDEHGMDEDCWLDAVHEAVDSDQYIIYTAKNQEVLDETSNEPDSSDVAAWINPKDQGDWRKVRMIAAFLAMEADINEHLRDLASNHSRCDECDNVYPNSEEDTNHSGFCPACAIKSATAEDEE